MDFMFAVHVPFRWFVTWLVPFQKDKTNPYFHFFLSFMVLVRRVKWSAYKNKRSLSGFLSEARLIVFNFMKF